MRAENLNAQNFVLDGQSGANLRSKLKQDPQAGLKQAAQQFEGLMLQMMLKSMRDASPQDGLMDNDQSRMFLSILDQQMAQNLSGQAKLGFAKLIEQQMGRNLASNANSTELATQALEQLSGGVQASASDLLVNPMLNPALNSAASAAANFADQANFLHGTALGGAQRIRSSASSNLVNPNPTAPLGNHEFVNRVWPHAVAAAQSIGVPAHFLVAQSALESAWGKSEIRLADGSPSHNLFGIKAGRGWSGRAVEVQTTEYVDGVAQSTREKFRVYDSYADSFADYADLLSRNARFSQVLGQQEGEQFARSLQKSGYATDPMYADKLSRIINGSTLRQALSG